MFPDHHACSPNDTSPLQRIAALAARTLAVPIAFITLQESEAHSRLIASVGEAAMVAGTSGAYERLMEPFQTPDGGICGTLCAAARRPHTFSPDDRATLGDLAALALQQLVWGREADAQRERNHLLQTVIDGIPEAIYVKDTQGRYLLMNAAGADYVGKTPTEIVGHDDAQLFPPEVAAQTRANDQQVLTTGRTCTFEDTELFSGVLRTHCSTKTLYYDSQGRVAGLLGISRDVTASKAVEKVLAERQARIAMLMEHFPGSAYIKDAHGRYLFVNEWAAAAFLRPVAEWIGRTDAELWPADMAALFQDSDRAVREGGKIFRSTDLIPHADGPHEHLSIKFPLCDAQGETIMIGGVTVDVTPQRRAEAALRSTDAALQTLIASSPVAIIALNEDGQVTLWNPAAERVFGWTAGETVGHPNPLSEGDSLSEAEFKANCRQVFGGATISGTEVRRRRKDGSVVDILVSAAPWRDTQGRVTQVLAVIEDITERKTRETERAGQLAEALERADRDPLTGLLNHRAFHKRLEDEADRTLRDGTPLTMAVMDLDNFKFFNDAYGHAVGDEVLRRVADALKGCCRSYDSLARFGGDEFAILMPGLNGADAAGLAARLRECARDIGYRPPGYDTVIPLGLSVGVAIFPDDGPGRLDVLEMADARLRRAKGGEGDDKTEHLRAALTRSLDGFSMLDALATAVDNKDRYTRRHSEDVLIYSLQIARELGLDEATQQTIQTAALLHDVGKIGVPDRILRKPGRLTPEEHQAIEHHATMGAIIVGAVPGFEGTLDAIRHHHERWDGTGYPFGLRGEETPLVARLMAVADAFSAMTTDRPYRQGMPHDQALAVLKQGAGTQWDPHCVAAFVNARLRTARPLAVGALP